MRKGAVCGMTRRRDVNSTCMGTASTYLTKVCALFEVGGGGDRRLIVVTDVSHLDWPPMHAGQTIEIRNTARPVVSTKVWIEHFTPFDPLRPVAFTVASDVTKQMIEIGAELWLPADVPPPPQTGEAGGSG